MSKLTAKERAAFPLANFGDAANRLYPIMDQSDVDAASHLIGKAADPQAVMKRIIAICRRKNLTPPAAWMEKMGQMSGK